MNPLNYSPGQMAKSIAAFVTVAVGLLGLAAAEFTEGPLAPIGGWAGTALIALTPVVVFLKKAEPWIGMVGNRAPDGSSE
jgi:hypothetical protein